MQYDKVFANLMEHILGEYEFAKTSPQFEVLVFDVAGDSKYLHEFDCEEAADVYARHITRDHTDLTARLSRKDSHGVPSLVVLYDDGNVSNSYVEVAH